jgi:hypothetical protein
MMMIPMKIALFTPIPATSENGHRGSYSGVQYTNSELLVLGRDATQSLLYGDTEQVKPCSTSHGPHAGGPHSPDVTVQHIQGTAGG